MRSNRRVFVSLVVSLALVLGLACVLLLPSCDECDVDPIRLESGTYITARLSDGQLDQMRLVDSSVPYPADAVPKKLIVDTAQRRVTLEYTSVGGVVVETWKIASIEQ